MTAGESDYSANVTAVLKAKPDIIYWTGYYQEGGLIIRQLRQAGYQGKIMVADGSVDAKLVQIAGAQRAEGVLATMTPTPETIEGAKGWIASYKKKFNSRPRPLLHAVLRRRARCGRGDSGGRQHRRRRP